MSPTSIDIPDTEEIHRIAYLTMHGWDYSTWCGWTKDGFTRTCHDRDRNKYEETVHDLEQAYEAQQERLGEG